MQIDEINLYKGVIKQKLLQNDGWQNLQLSREWIRFNVPNEAGVYAFKKDGVLAYVGETGNLQKRMLDMLDSRNHVLRRTLGKLLFADHKDFVPATTSVKFCDEIEELLNRYISSRLEVAFVEVPFGRKEIEEMIFDEIDADVRLNKRGKRAN